jgi:predicted GNAT family N-acyltransferase
MDSHVTESTVVKIRQVSASEVYPLRHKVLRPKQTLADCVWAQDTDPDTAHFAAEHNGQIIGIASLAICPRDGDPPNTWRLRGMATEPSCQGQGIGAQVLAACLDHARRQGSSLMWCNARTSALAFYRKHGFETVGEEFETKGVGPHYVMVRTL